MAAIFADLDFINNQWLSNRLPFTLSVRQCSVHMHGVIDSSSQVSFLNTVKLDHVVWKNAIYSKIANQQFGETVNKHTECRLGKWYFQGAGAALYNQSSSFKAIDAPHKQVHDMGREALSAGSHGDIDKMNTVLLTMENASVQVAAALDRLIDEILQAKSSALHTKSSALHKC